MARSTRKGSSPVALAFGDNAGSLSRFLRRFLDSPADVEDLMQETFLKVFEAERGTNISNPKAFLFKTARNLALNELAKRRNRRTDSVEDLEGLAVSPGEWSELESLPEAHFATQERLARAWGAIQELSPRVREVFVLHKVHGLKQREIARRLGISESTVEKHIAKGLAGMAAQIKTAIDS